MTKRILMAAAAALSAAQWAAAQAPAETGDKHVLKLDDVELNTLIADVSMLTGYTFITHPDVRKARVSVVSQTPMSTADVFQVFLTTLRVQGFAAIPAGRDTYRIVPESVAATEAPISGQGSNAFITEIIRLDYANAMDVAQQIKPVLDSQGQIAANANTNTLVIVDYASNLQRVRRMIESIDRDPSITETVALSNVPALEMEAVLNRLQGGATPDGNTSAGGRNFLAVASETSNSVLLRGDTATVNKAREVALQYPHHSAELYRCRRDRSNPRARRPQHCGAAFAFRYGAASADDFAPSGDQFTDPQRECRNAGRDGEGDLRARCTPAAGDGRGDHRGDVG
jgi:general secretion pathway protein D